MNTKNIFSILAFLAITFVVAQERPEPTATNEGELTAVTYYHENGIISQKGTFNQQGKLHGVWTSYDLKGNKTMVGIYDNNKKVGKWLIWSDDTLREVEYEDSKIAGVSEWKDKVQLATSN